MSNDWDEYAATWEHDEATAIFAQSCFEQLTDITSLTRKTVLDFGCGTGLLSQLMSPHAKQIIALDGSESMIEELDKKALNNVEPVVDLLTRGLVAQHPAFRNQFDLVVASSVCGFIDNLQETANIIYTLLDEYGLFIQWDWAVESDDAAYGMTTHRAETVLLNAGFESVTVSVPFEIDTGKGVRPVLMAVARK
ncbi:SAM-dependent methyltransferase [Vibrio sp. 10N.286.49.C2]|uniref:class I SAM-dependent DNA methyltransferase n=1 Tax=Vibrio sp. 10N.286.49.C2 TaxID=1880856 RepID=UPI000C8365FE|nr:MULTISPECIES: class I SAM-dependent methyltransferase [unclassified Vibrio]PMH43371.1 SAM-dependent methyltransferase [Vibrio sp. 10N.286.49.C2]PMH57023.1 SAM-dependent methyltransferase [Vibrio sp. 10N.286.49.B1]PMH83005.1 SAM-dependent methyltransferase [Vibrio sp. 10N.286.48.B7]